jgi:branched-chain amino acid transport system substrate-binding protein
VRVARGRRVGSVRALVVAISLLVLACGGSGTGEEQASKGLIIVASDLPISGADASIGLPTEHGVQFAVEQEDAVKGFRLAFVGMDDALQGRPDRGRGVQNLRQLIANPRVLGVVGPLDSSVAAAELPVANRAQLAMISPSNEADCLTRPKPDCGQTAGYSPQSLRPTGRNTYFRTAASAGLQGSAMADFAIDTLKVGRFAVWDDRQPNGSSAAAAFAREVAARGGQVVSRQSYDPGAKPRFTDLLLDGKRQGAQAFYVGATAGTQGCVARSQMASVFPDAADVYWLGPQGMANARCIADAGAMADDHVYATQGLADAQANPQAAATIEAYRKVFPKPADLGPYTFGAYDDADVLIDAIGRAIDANGGDMPSRRQVVDALSSTRDFKGLTGTIAFDPNGDLVAPSVEIQRVSAATPQTACGSTTLEGVCFAPAEQVSSVRSVADEVEVGDQDDEQAVFDDDVPRQGLLDGVADDAAVHVPEQEQHHGEQALPEDGADRHGPGEEGHQLGHEDREQHRPPWRHRPAQHPEGPVGRGQRDHEGAGEPQRQVERRAAGLGHVDQERPRQGQHHDRLLNHQVAGPGLVPQVPIVETGGKAHGRPEGHRQQHVHPQPRQERGQAGHHQRPQGGGDEVLRRGQLGLHTEVGENGQRRQRQQAGGDGPDLLGRQLPGLQGQRHGDQHHAHEDQEARIPFWRCRRQHDLLDSGWSLHDGTYLGERVGGALRHAPVAVF